MTQISDERHPEEHGHWDVADIRRLLFERDSLRRELQQRRAQDRSMGDSSGKISDNDGHSLRKREESMDGESPTQQTDLPEQYVNICAVCATAFGGPTKREVICPACNPAQQAQPVSKGLMPDRLDDYADRALPGSQFQSDLYAAATLLRKAGPYAAPQPAQADEGRHPEEHGHWDVGDIRRLLHQRDEARELLREVLSDYEYLNGREVTAEVIERIRAYLARAGARK